MEGESKTIPDVSTLEQNHAKDGVISFVAGSLGTYLFYIQHRLFLVLLKRKH